MIIKKKKTISNKKREKAQAMVVVFVYISVMSLMGIYMMLYASNLHNLVIREINYQRAFYAAEAGLLHSYSNLCNGGGGDLNLSFPPMTVGVTATGIGNGFSRIRAIVSDWQQW